MVNQDKAVNFDDLFKDTEVVDLDTQATQQPALNRDLGAPIEETREAANNAAGFEDFTIPTNQKEVIAMGRAEIAKRLDINEDDKATLEAAKDFYERAQNRDLDADTAIGFAEQLAQNEKVQSFTAWTLKRQVDLYLKSKDVQSAQASWNLLSDAEKFALFKDSYKVSVKNISDVVYKKMNGPISGIIQMMKGKSKEHTDYSAHEIQYFVLSGIFETSPGLMRQMLKFHKDTLESRKEILKEQSGTIAQVSGVVGGVVGGIGGAFSGGPAGAIAGAKSGATTGTKVGAAGVAYARSLIELNKITDATLPEVREYAAQKQAERLENSVFGTQELVRDQIAANNNKNYGLAA